jgi:hypothetical protein
MAAMVSDTPLKRFGMVEEVAALRFASLPTRRLTSRARSSTSTAVY